MGRSKSISQPDISIIIPCYNIEPYIDACLHSVLVQKIIKNCEIVCVNDGSVDGTTKKLEKYSKKYPSIIKLINNRSNLGVSMARNAGIEASTGKNIMFLDGDDTIGGNPPNTRVATNYLSNFLDTLNQSPNYGMTIGNILVTDQANNEPVYNQRFSNIFNQSTKKIITHDRALDFLDNRISSCAALYRSNIIKDHKISFSTELTYFEDAEFITSYALSSIQDYKYILKPVHDYSFYMYRRRADSAMTKLSRHSEKFMRRLERTKNKLAYYSELLLSIKNALGQNSHMYNIGAHRYTKTIKQINEYAKTADAGMYENLSKYIPKNCIGCLKNRCIDCENANLLLNHIQCCHNQMLTKIR